MTTPIYRRVFPTARLLTTAAPQTPEWYAARRRGITATDVVSILRLTDYGNALSVWLDKRGELPPDSTGEAAVWGNLLEDVVAREWARRHTAAQRGETVKVRRVGVVCNDWDPWMIASVDRRVHGCLEGSSCILEVKTRSAWVRDGWRDGTPDDVYAQVLWQLMVTGVDHAHVAVLVGGQELLIPDVVRLGDDTADVERMLRAEGWATWCSHLEGQQPDVPADQVLADLLDRVYTSRAGNAVVAVDPATAAIRDYLLHSQQERSAKGRKAEARARLVALLGDAEAACFDDAGSPVWTYRRPAASTRIDVAAIEVADPDLYATLIASYGVTSTPSSRINITKHGKALVDGLLTETPELEG